MTGDEDLAELVARLVALPTPIRVEVLRQVFSATESQDRHGLRDRWHIGVVHTYDGPGAEGLTRETAVVGYPDRDYYSGGYGPEPELWESGTCPGCGEEVVSSAKRATCPICGSMTSLT
jgi:hypothetical protein